MTPGLGGAAANKIAARVVTIETLKSYVPAIAMGRVQVPALSIVVVFHNMRREARRTLYSLSADYQTGVEASNYEVIAIDNGSSQPLNREEVEAFGANFRYQFFDTASVSPVDAVNAGVNMAISEHVAVIVDGARMATPGIVWGTLKGLQAFPEPFVCALSWHLGSDIQGTSMQAGYDQAEEDQLLASITWPDDGYRLFDISTIAPSSRGGFFGDVPPECSWFAMPRESFLKLGGFDSEFRSPGGGFVNHDFRNRALTATGVRPIVLLGEGLFHQFHGGICTNVKTQKLPETLASFREEYRTIRGHDNLALRSPAAVYFGSMPAQARRFLFQNQP